MGRPRGFSVNGGYARTLREGVASSIEAFVVSPVVGNELSSRTVRQIETGGPVSRQSLVIFARAVNLADWKDLLTAPSREALSAAARAPGGAPLNHNSGRWKLEMIFRTWSGQVVPSGSVTARGDVILWLPTDGQGGFGSIHATLHLSLTGPDPSGARLASTILVADDVYDAFSKSDDEIEFNSETFCRHVLAPAAPTVELPGLAHQRPGINSFQWRLEWDTAKNKFVGKQRNETMQSDEATVYLSRRDARTRTT